MIVIPLSLLAGQQSLLYSAPPASFAATFVFGIWVARKAPQREPQMGFPRHGRRNAPPIVRVEEGPMDIR